MLFTWSSKDLCIIFRQWRVDGPFSLLVSLVVIVLLTAGYEGIRQLTRRYEAAHAQRLNAFNTPAVGGKPYSLSIAFTSRYTTISRGKPFRGLG